MRRFSKQFTVDNITYELTVSESHTLNIELLYGKTKDGKAITFYEESFDCNASKFGISNVTKNPMKVLSTFVEHTLKYLYEYSPPILTFCAMEENRAKVYERLIRTNIPSTYNLCVFNGSFTLYRK